MVGVASGAGRVPVLVVTVPVERSAAVQPGGAPLVLVLVLAPVQVLVLVPVVRVVYAGGCDRSAIFRSQLENIA